MIRRMVRYLAIICIFVLVLAEMFFSGSGAFRSNPVFEYAVVLAFIGVAVIAFEGICMHEYSRLAARNDDKRVIALSLWAVCFVLGMLFTTVGIKARGEANQAVKVAGWTKRDNVEKNTADLERELTEAEATIARVKAQKIKENGVEREVNPIKRIEADGRFIATNGCTGTIDERKKWTAGQRVICQEHGLAIERDNAMVAKQHVSARLGQSRDKLDTTEVVVSKTATDAGIFVDMGMSPKAASYLIAGIVAILLHGVTSFGFFIIPRLDDDETPTTAGSANAGSPHAVHVHVGQQTQAPASTPSQVLVLNEKDEALRRWAETIPNKPN